MLKIAKFSTYLQIILVASVIIGGVGFYIHHQNKQIEQVTKDKNDLTGQLLAEQKQALELAKINAENVAESRKQAKIAQDLQAIAEQERDQATKRAATHTSIQSNITNAKPGDRSTPISPVITDTINQLYK